MIDTRVGRPLPIPNPKDRVHTSRGPGFTNWVGLTFEVDAELGLYRGAEFSSRPGLLGRKQMWDTSTTSVQG